VFCKWGNVDRICRNPKVAAEINYQDWCPESECELRELPDYQNGGLDMFGIPDEILALYSTAEEFDIFKDAIQGQNVFK